MPDGGVELSDWAVALGVGCRVLAGTGVAMLGDRFGAAGVEVFVLAALEPFPR